MTVTSENRIPVAYKGLLYRKSNGALILNSTDFDTAVEIMKTDGIKHLEINSNFFKGKELSFLSKFPFIEGLSILSSLIENISPIQTLSNLKVLNIENKLQGEIDFKIFKNLEECFFIWGLKGSETIFNASSLFKLRIDNYKKFEIFEIANLQKLKSLSLYFSNITNLSGISDIKGLIKLDLTGCSNLEDIHAINSLLALIELRLDECKSLTSLEPIKSLIHLKSLSFNNIGKLASIKYLSTLNKLEEIFFSDNTNIEDGDLNGLQNLYQKGSLKKAIYITRRHYSHKPSDLGYRVPDVVSNMFRKK